jgi:two-component system OmpR family sensor kinase
VIALLAIAAAGFAVLGVAGADLLRGYVTDRADAQLKDVSAQLGSMPRYVPVPYGGMDPERRGGYGYGFYRSMAQALPHGVIAQQAATDGGFTREFGEPSWTGWSGPVVPADVGQREGRPFTVPARTGSGHWRMLVTKPSEGTTLMVATDIQSVDAMVGRLTEVVLLIGGLALAAMAYVGFRVVRTGAAPLTEIERTVEAAVAGDLSRRVPVPAQDTEPGQVAQAVNTLIDEIDDARQAEKRTRHSVGEAGRAVRQRLNVIQGIKRKTKKIENGKEAKT